MTTQKREREDSPTEIVLQICGSKATKIWRIWKTSQHI